MHTRGVGPQELGRADLWRRPTARSASNTTCSQTATNLAENPLGSLPTQMHTWKATKALYRLRSVPDVTFAALMQPHVHQTSARAKAAPVSLRVPDTTDIDWSHRRKISGVGQIGNERERGFFLQTVLAVCPQTRAVLGCLAQEPLVRVPAPKARSALSTAQARGARNRRLDAPDTGHWKPSARHHLGSCRRPGRGHVPLLPGRPPDADPLVFSEPPRTGEYQDTTQR